MEAGASVAVVLVEAGSGEHLPRALAALAAQRPSPRRVIVVDNTGRLADPGGGVEVLRPGRNLGFAAANNRAVAHAGDCEHVALLNPDAFPREGWLAALLAAADRHPEAAAFGSRLVTAADPGRLDATAVALHPSGIAWLEGHGRPAVEPAALASREILVPSAAAALYRRAAFLAVGAFDERFFCYAEDVDLALRLALAGHRARYVPEAVAEHVGSATTAPESDFAVYHSQRNLMWAWWKTMPTSLAVAYLPSHLLAIAALTAWFCARGRGRAVLRARRDAMLGLPRVLRQRRALQATRRVGAGDLRRRLATGTAVLGR